MTWAWALSAPLAMQASATMFDEWHFHRRRGLGRWERIGHPLDTLSVLACLGCALFVAPGPRAMVAYGVLAALSCVFITKDEFVHAARCSPGEHWVHALLFVAHPISLAVVALLWPALHAPPSALPQWLAALSPAAPLVIGQFALVAAFFVYQVLYWNLAWPRRTAIAR